MGRECVFLHRGKAMAATTPKAKAEATPKAKQTAKEKAKAKAKGKQPKGPKAMVAAVRAPSPLNQ